MATSIKKRPALINLRDEPPPVDNPASESHCIEESQGEERALKINLDLILDRVQAACGLYDGVEGLCTWEREESELEKINWKHLAEDHPKIAEANMTDEKRTAAFKPKPYRPY